MSRKLPKFFAYHYLPELFFADPLGTISDLFLAKKLAEAWQAGAEHFREFTIRESPPTVKPLFWRNYRATMIELCAPKAPGESRAIVLSWREALKEPRIFCLEKAESNWALTSIASDRSHHYHLALEDGDSEGFLAKARQLVGS